MSRYEENGEDFEGQGNGAKYGIGSPPAPPREREGGGYRDGDSPYNAFEEMERKHSSRDRSGREKDRERNREREKDRVREKERDKPRERERERDKDRHRSRDVERHRSSRGDEDRHRDKERDGEREDRERRHRHGSSSHHRSKSPSRSRHHQSRRRSKSRSRSRSTSKSRRVTGFDMAPPGMTPPAAPSGGAMPNQPAMAGMYNMFNMQMQAGMMPMQAMTQQATRHARRVYVGGLPPMANEQTIATFFSRVMTAIGGNTAGPGDAVVNVYINHEKKFAFVEMRTVEEASNAMALDGIMFEGVSVRVRRPTDYNPSLAAALGPSQPSPLLNLAAVGLTAGAVGGAVGPDRVFVGGLPYYLTEAQIRELLESFGTLRGFDLVRDRDTGNSKGYAFCVYQDPGVTDIACAALNGLKMGDKTLTVRRATVTGQPKPDQDIVLQQAQQHIAMQKLALQGSVSSMYPLTVQENPTKVVCLTQVVSPEELGDDEEFQDILDDMREECGKFGEIVNLHIPRPSPEGEMRPGVGKVFVEYSDIEGATKAKNALHGRKFGGNSVVAVYFSEEKFSSGDYE